MPYIPQKDRPKWNEAINKVVEILQGLDDITLVEGNLNFFITSILKKVYPPKYFNYNRAIGLLECIKQEFYRRQVASYEDGKIKTDGDLD
jgi:hypothetical protein